MQRRYLTLFLLMFLISCGECQPAEEVKEVQKASGQTSCPGEPVCDIGVKRCADEKDYEECMPGPDGCGQWQGHKSWTCQNTQWCYNGGCFEAETVNPPAATPSDFESIMAWSEHEVPLDTNITVIPYEAFINAIRMDEQHDEALSTHAQIAADTVMKGNDPNVLGVTAYMEAADEFSGDIFLVMVDPTYSPFTGGNPQSQTMPLVESKRYFLAAMPGLRGHTTWVGKFGSQRAMFNMAFPTTCCHGSDQPPQSGGFGDPDSGPLPSGPCPEDLPDCFLPVNLASLIQTDPTKQPFRYGGEAQMVTDPMQIQPKLQLRGNGMPAVFMYNGMGSDWHSDQFQDSPTGPLANLTYFPIQYKFTPPLFLDWCSQAMCLPDPPVSNALDNDSASDLCGNATLGGQDIPDECKMMTPNPNKARGECGGATFGMYGETLPDGMCHLTVPGQTSDCGGMPAFCKWADDCDTFCDSNCKENYLDFMKEFYNCAGPGGLSTQGTATGNATCTENGVCKTLSDGTEQCFECNEAGACRKTLKSNPLQPDPRYFTGDYDSPLWQIIGAPITEDVVAGEAQQIRSTDEAVNADTVPAATPRQPRQVIASDGEDKVDPNDGDQQKTEAKMDPVNNSKYIPPPGKFERTQDSGQRASDSIRAPHKGQSPSKKNGKKGATAADPIVLSTGALSVEHTDMRFPGPVKALKFERYYDSKSDGRSVLGSNWSHNYDMRIEHITHGNIPDWAPRYCVAEQPRVTCAFVHYPGGYSRLFVKGPGDPNNLFYPQAGSAETLRFDGKFWQMRNLEGDMWGFNELGYLTNQRDRFGNGFKVEYEDTPLHKVFKKVCHATNVRTQGNASLGSISEALQPTNPANSDFITVTLNNPSYNAAACRTLATIFGDQAPQEVISDGMELFNADNNLPTLLIPRAAIGSADQEAWSYAQWLLTQDVNVDAPTGQHKMRPVRVTDDLGRTLNLNYYDEFATNDLVPTPSIQEQVNYGLLKEVIGPDNITKTSFTYGRPANYPVGLQESFLVKVNRTDESINPSEIHPQAARELSFDYGWNTQSSWLDQFNGYANHVEDSYRNFFGTFTGCDWYKTGSNTAGNGATVCSEEGTPGGMPGQFFVCNDANPATSISTCWAPTKRRQGHNPCYLARKERERYLSRVADNLILLKRNTIVEVKSHYIHDPNSHNFDRITKQRYGGMTGPADNHNWTSTSTHEATLEYYQVRPVDNGTDDVTSGQLPPDILSRYELENDAAEWDPIKPCIHNSSCVMGDNAVPAPSCTGDVHNNPNIKCNSNNHLRWYADLPGVFPTWKYFPATEGNSPTQFPRLYRSRLTCEQLASRTLGDPTHNGTMKHLDAQAGVWKYIADDRARIEVDSRRICAWTKVTDRDGDEQLYGMNFRGQAVVEATKTNGVWLVQETIVNADGQIKQQRQMTTASGGHQWTPADGYIEHTYANYNGKTAQDKPSWRPFWWLKRFNRTSTTVYPNTQAALSQPSFVHDVDGQFNFSGEQLLSYKTELIYEPLYNQPQTIISSVETSTGPKVVSKVIYDFDYQELALNSVALKEGFLRSHMWGLELPEDARGVLSSDPMVAQSAQTAFEDWLDRHMGMAFYNNKDINGDGVYGFVDDPTTPSWAVRAFPVRMTVFNPDANGSTPAHDQLKMTYIWPSPHGQPNRIVEPDGTQTLMEYYSTKTNQYGDAQPTTTAQSGINYRGLLGRVLKQRVQTDYEESNAGADGSLTHSTACQSLRGPYQWMMPQGCPNGVQSALNQLNIPADVQNELLAMASPTGESNWSITTLTYAKTGHVLKMAQNGVVSTMLRDTDGRLMKNIDPQGNITNINRDLDGWPVEIEVTTSANELLHKSMYQYDTEGNVLSKCTVVEGSAPESCGTYNWSTPIAMTTTRDTTSPTHLLETYRYTNEGQLIQAVDAMGYETQWEHDSRGLLTKKLLIDAAQSSNNRQTQWEYDTLGRKTKTIHGTTVMQASDPRDEEYAYDGFGRMIQYIDDSQVKWQMAWNKHGTMAAYKQDDTKYQSQTPMAQPTATWEIWRSYDGFGRPAKERAHNLTQTVYNYGVMGYLRHVQSQPVTGGQTTNDVWLTYDAQGQPVWQVDGEGNQQFITWNPVTRRKTSTVVRVDNQDNAITHTTTQMVDLDTLGHPTSMTTLGQQGETQLVQQTFNGLGHLLSSTDPANKQTTYNRNLLGWPNQVTQPGDQASSISSYLYNAAGQVTQITEPGQPGGVTVYQYNRFGELSQRQMPMYPNHAHDMFYYDGYGRLSQHQQYQNGQLGDSIGFTYQRLANGVEQTKTVWNNSPVNSSELATHQYDRFGRLIMARAGNVGLMHLLGQTQPRVAQTDYQYDALGRVLSETQTRFEGTTQVWQKTTTSTHTLDDQGLWKRNVIYPSGSAHSRLTDSIGRMRGLSESNRQGNAISPIETSFKWLGGMYKGRSQAFKLAGSTVVPDPLEEHIGFDGLGRRIQMSYNTLQFNGSGQPTNAAWANHYCQSAYSAGCGEDLLKIEMKYDVTNRLTSVRRRFDHPVFDNGGTLVTGAHQSRWRGFGYNAKGQLTGQWHIDDMSDATFGTLNNHTLGDTELEQVGYPNGAGHKLDYNREQHVGDLLSITRADNPSIKLWQHKDVNGSSSFYKGGHRLDHVEIDGQGPQPVTYDGRGRMTKDTRFEYAYDPTDRLIAARPIGQSTWSETYIYDGLHRLVEEESGGQVRKMVYDGAQMIAMYEGAQLQWEAIWGANLDQLVRWHHVPSDTSYIPLQDHRNNIVSLFNASTGRVVQMMDYDANGRMTVLEQDEQTSCVEQGTGQVCDLIDAFPFGFNGAWRSNVTGLSNMRMRWYAPHLGTFMSQDPLEYVDSFNTYAFAAFDPVNGWDPLGLKNKSLVFVGHDSTADTLNKLSGNKNMFKSRKLTPDEEKEFLQRTSENYTKKKKDKGPVLPFNHNKNKRLRFTDKKKAKKFLKSMRVIYYDEKNRSQKSDRFVTDMIIDIFKRLKGKGHLLIVFNVNGKAKRMDEAWWTHGSWLGKKGKHKQMGGEKVRRMFRPAHATVPPAVGRKVLDTASNMTKKGAAVGIPTSNMKDVWLVGGYNMDYRTLGHELVIHVYTAMAGDMHGHSAPIGKVKLHPGFKTAKYVPSYMKGTFTGSTNAHYHRYLHDVIFPRNRKISEEK